MSRRSKRRWGARATILRLQFSSVMYNLPYLIVQQVFHESSQVKDAWDSTVLLDFVEPRASFVAKTPKNFAPNTTSKFITRSLPKFLKMDHLLQLLLILPQEIVAL